MFHYHRHKGPEPPAPDTHNLTSCGHSHRVGTCPSCQRATAARLHAQEEQVAPGIVTKHQIS